MCIAAPYRVIEITDNGKALIDINGIRQEINMQLVPDVKAGDYVIAYLGSALAIVEEEEAVEAIRLYQQMAGLEILGDIPPMQK
ncbi:HypC/HybG/HupF family hydrogenase formation chaperone [Chloroflexota bacterium]